MGDFRATIKIQFKMGDFRDATDMWINWSPDSSGYPGVDQRILDWFENAGEKGSESIRQGMDNYRPKVMPDDEERAEYERLKAKFES